MFAVSTAGAVDLTEWPGRTRCGDPAALDACYELAVDAFGTFLLSLVVVVALAMIVWGLQVEVVEPRLPESWQHQESDAEWPALLPAVVFGWLVVLASRLTAFGWVGSVASGGLVVFLGWLLTLFFDRHERFPDPPRDGSVTYALLWAVVDAAIGATILVAFVFWIALAGVRRYLPGWLTSGNEYEIAVYFFITVAPVAGLLLVALTGGRALETILDDFADRAEDALGSLDRTHSSSVLNAERYAERVDNYLYRLFMLFVGFAPVIEFLKRHATSPEKLLLLAAVVSELGVLLLGGLWFRRLLELVDSDEALERILRRKMRRSVVKVMLTAVGLTTIVYLSDAVFSALVEYNYSLVEAHAATLETNELVRRFLSNQALDYLAILGSIAFFEFFRPFVRWLIMMVGILELTPVVLGYVHVFRTRTLVHTVTRRMLVTMTGTVVALAYTGRLLEVGEFTRKSILLALAGNCMLALYDWFVETGRSDSG